MNISKFVKNDSILSIQVDKNGDAWFDIFTSDYFAIIDKNIMHTSIPEGNYQICAKAFKKLSKKNTTWDIKNEHFIMSSDGCTLAISRNGPCIHRRVKGHNTPIPNDFIPELKLMASVNKDKTMFTSAYAYVLWTDDKLVSTDGATMVVRKVKYDCPLDINISARMIDHLEEDKDYTLFSMLYRKDKKTSFDVRGFECDDYYFVVNEMLDKFPNWKHIANSKFEHTESIDLDLSELETVNPEWFYRNALYGSFVNVLDKPAAKGIDVKLKIPADLDIAPVQFKIKYLLLLWEIMNKKKCSVLISYSEPNKCYKFSVNNTDVYIMPMIVA